MNLCKYSKIDLKILGLYGLIVLIFFLPNFRYFETDFLWIMKGGEWILTNHKIPHTDIWSYTLGDYLWVFHEWGSGIIMHLVYTNFNYWGLVLIGSIITTLGLLISSPKKIIKKYAYIYIIFALFITLMNSGFRPQQFSFLFIGLFFYLFTKYFKEKNLFVLILIPIIMLFWVNLHGGFFLGLAISFYMLVLKSLQKIGMFKNQSFISVPTRKDIFFMVIVFVLTLIATLVNPYGVHIYREVFNTLFAASVPIIEWAPTANVFMYIIFGLFATIITISRKKIPFEYLIACYFGLFALIVQKFIPVFLIIGAYPLCLALNDMQEKNNFEKINRAFRRVNKGIILLVVLLMVAITKHGLEEKWDKPDKAIGYLKTNSAPGNYMFNNYGWGGYLIAHYPEQKVFIDGRMASWKEKDRFLAKDFLLVSQGKLPYSELFENYGVDWAILYVKNDGLLIQALGKDKNWLEIYHDDVSVIFKKK